MAKWIKTDGTVVEVQPKNGTDFSLEELQWFVRGYIEIIGHGKDGLMVVNEEGKLDGLPLNVTASLMAGQTIAGNVIVCMATEIK